MKIFLVGFGKMMVCAIGVMLIFILLPFDLIMAMGGSQNSVCEGIDKTIRKIIK